MEGTSEDKMYKQANVIHSAVHSDSQTEETGKEGMGDGKDNL